MREKFSFHVVLTITSSTFKNLANSRANLWLTLPRSLSVKAAYIFPLLFISVMSLEYIELVDIRIDISAQNIYLNNENFILCSMSAAEPDFIVVFDIKLIFTKCNNIYTT